jgi:pyruvate,water dikinase
VDLERIEPTDLAVVGGKAAQLRELTRIEGIAVPGGFCVTTDAFEQSLAAAPSFAELLAELSRVAPQDRAAIRTLSAQLRRSIEVAPIPGEVGSAIAAALSRLGAQAAVAVRSSATAEDLAGASFAGQYDSFLGVVGEAAVLAHVRRCWASLFGERAVSYRRRNGFSDRDVRMAVLVQRMVPATAAGILFTADPVTSNRKIATVEAVAGLGEALASGQANADVYAVRDAAVVSATHRLPTPVLTDEQVVRLALLGRRIEAHFGRPQDVEWCLAGGDFEFVQSRPITTLFPIPVIEDGANHVFVSVGHLQMMTEAMRPLGLSLWRLTTPRLMYEAGGRLFVDVAPDLASPAAQARLLGLAQSDPLIGEALQTLLDRRDFVPAAQPDAPAPAPGPAPVPIETDPAIVIELIEQNRASVAILRREIEKVSGPALLDFIVADIAELKRILFDPRSSQVIMAGMQAKWWLDEHLEGWLGEKDAADTLTRSVSHNVTAEMGLALLDVADTIRPHAQVVDFLHIVAGEGRDDFLDDLAALPGGAEASEAIRGFLDEYGMRCAGEIDVTRTRWSERPATLVPTILGNVANFEAGAGRRRFEQGLAAAQRKERDVLARLRALPDGESKAEETGRMIDRVRTFAGYREYPKYGFISRYFVYKQALLREAGRLVGAGVLRAADDIYYLRLDELHDVVRTGAADADLILRRRREFASYETLRPPRVFTSDGEALAVQYRSDAAPPGAIAGLPVSSGTVEGRARVVTDMARAELEAGDILVTPYTDPSWTPLFLTAAGLVTEVGGLMTHGAVIAREYGLPAVVGVHRATQLIRDGQRIRVDGTSGYVLVIE